MAMKYHEKKYKVESFESIRAKLNELGAKQIKRTSSTHYYVPQDSNDVVKLVHYTDRDEIHLLKEENGTFSLTENVPVQDLEGGFHWLKRRVFEQVDVVKMDYIDYEYDNGTVGLYTLNDSLLSVILDFPKEKHAEMEKAFGLGSAEVIAIPYNKYLNQVGLSVSKIISNDE